MKSNSKITTLLNYCILTLFLISSVTVLFIEQPFYNNVLFGLSALLMVSILVRGIPSFVLRHLIGISRYEIVRSAPTMVQLELLRKPTERPKQDKPKFEPTQNRPEKTMTWGQRLKRQVTDYASTSLLGKALKVGHSRASSNTKKPRSQGKPLEDIFQVYDSMDSLQKGQFRVHSHNRITTDTHARFIPRQYIENEDNVLKRRLLDEYWSTLQNLRLENINIDDRHMFVKKGIYKMLKKYNQEQATSLLILALSIEAFFQVKINYDNPYSKSTDQRIVGDNLVDIISRYKLISNKSNDTQEKLISEGLQTGALSYLTYSNGVFQRVSRRQNLLHRKFNEIVQKCVKNPFMEFRSKMQAAYQTAQLGNAIDMIYNYIQRGQIEYPPWRYKEGVQKEQVFYMMRGAVNTRKQLDSYLVAYNERSFTGNQRIQQLGKSSYIEKKLHQQVLQRRFPSSLYEQSRQKSKWKVDKIQQKLFLLKFLCSIVRKTLPRNSYLAPSLTAPSFFNFRVNDYYLIFKETGYETGQPHFNLRYKHQGAETVVSCCPGPDNFYSLVYLYFLTLLNKQDKFISEHSDLRILIGQMLPIEGI